ncbi:hypothetical protein ACS0TY_009652 [Phlomoides rotata]
MFIFIMESEPLFHRRIHHFEREFNNFSLSSSNSRSICDLGSTLFTKVGSRLDGENEMEMIHGLSYSNLLSLCISLYSGRLQSGQLAYSLSPYVHFPHCIEKHRCGHNFCYNCGSPIVGHYCSICKQ